MRTPNPHPPNAVLTRAPACLPSICSSLVSLFGSSSSAKAINYSHLAQQASTVMAAAQKGDYSGCMPLLGVRGPGGMR